MSDFKLINTFYLYNLSIIINISFKLSASIMEHHLFFLHIWFPKMLIILVDSLLYSDRTLNYLIFPIPLRFDLI